MATMHTGDDEFVTIIGTDMEAITFRAQGLSEQRYAIIGRAGRHRFAFATDAASDPLFGGRPVMAATYRRCVGR